MDTATINRGVAQLAEQGVHTAQVARSTRTPATKLHEHPRFMEAVRSLDSLTVEELGELAALTLEFATAREQKEFTRSDAARDALMAWGAWPIGTWHPVSESATHREARIRKYLAWGKK